MWLYTSSDLCSPFTNSLLMSYTQQQRCDPIHYLATHSLCAIVDDPCAFIAIIKDEKFLADWAHSRYITGFNCSVCFSFWQNAKSYSNLEAHYNSCLS